MEQNQFSDFPWMTSAENSSPKRNKPHRGGSMGMWLSVLCVVIALTVILTYTLTSISVRSSYIDALQSKQNEIASYRQELEMMKSLMEGSDPEEGASFSKLEFLSMLFEMSSYYIDTVDEKEMLDAVLKAYAEATGDNYAEYYTEEEYAEMVSASVGNQVGIGVSVLQTDLTVDGYTYQVFQILSIFKNAPAEGSGLRVGDYVYGVKHEGTYQTVQALGGFTSALNLFRGEAGTDISFVVFRPEGTSYTSHEFTITRGAYVSESVTFAKSENNPKVGIVRISEFNLTTPKQLKAAMSALLTDGAEKFIFDVRNNPGGDLMSIKAVMSYFLNTGDLILSAIDKNGEMTDPYYAEPMQWSGNYASCNVLASEIGMYRDLDMVVLCNGNTASAAEVFTATLRDYGLAKIVGETTFGKGVMQTIIGLKDISYGMYDGYAKMTTHAYVTKCGVTYHDVGIAPDVESSLSEEALKYSIYTLPQTLDDQLQAALAQFH